MKKHHVDVLIAESDVHSRIAELGAEITKHYQEKQVNNLVVIGLLRGSFMFMADIVRHIHLPVEIEFMQFKDMGNVDDIETWTNLKAVYDYGNDGKIMYIDTLEGVMTANIGDYIVKGLNGEFYPVKPDVFEKSYEVIGK